MLNYFKGDFPDKPGLTGRPINFPPPFSLKENVWG